MWPTTAVEWQGRGDCGRGHCGAMGAVSGRLRSTWTCDCRPVRGYPDGSATRKRVPDCGYPPQWVGYPAAAVGVLRRNVFMRGGWKLPE